MAFLRSSNVIFEPFIIYLFIAAIIQIKEQRSNKSNSAKNQKMKLFYIRPYWRMMEPLDLLPTLPSSSFNLLTSITDHVR